MNALIQIQTATLEGEEAQTVNARELHGFLEVGSAFKDWIARRIADYGFTEGKDFCSFLSESSGGRPSKEYALSLSMAKELAMVERNEKGKQARAYFIECERRAQQQPALDPASLSRMDILKLAMDSEEGRLKAEAELAIAAPKAHALDLIAADDQALTVTQAAKVLGIKREALTTWLHANGWMYRQNGSWVAYQQHIQSGRLQFKEARYTDANTGQECHRPYCHILPKGLAVLAKHFAVN